VVRTRPDRVIDDYGRVMDGTVAGDGARPRTMIPRSRENFGFTTRRSLVIWGDQMIRKGFLRPLERVLLHSPLMVWAPFASNVHHDWMWYPTIGQARIRAFMRTEWGQLFRKY
jgi:hypothetical protein